MCRLNTFRNITGEIRKKKRRGEEEEGKEKEWEENYPIPLKTGPVSSFIYQGRVHIQPLWLLRSNQNSKS